MRIFNYSLYFWRLKSIHNNHIMTQEKNADAIAQLQADLERKNKELESYKKQVAFLRTLLNEMPVRVFVKDPANEFRYLYCNQQFIDSLGKGKSVVGKQDFEIFNNDKEEAEKARQHDITVVENNKAQNYEKSYREKDGNISPLMMMKKPLSIPEYEDTLLLGTAIDFSKIPHVDKKLVEAYSQSERDNRKKNTFMSNLSHEARTPLNAIVGFTELLTNPEIEISQSEKDEYLSLIKSNVALLMSIFNDILDMSKLETGTVQFNITEFNLSEMMESIYSLYEQKLEGKDVKLIFEKPDEPLTLRQDMTKCLQILYNFLNNAIKYTEHGHIAYGYQVLPDNMVKIYVSDTGMGISKENQKIVFDRFEKLGSKVQGTGLGLAIVKGLSEAMGGSCGVDSELGKGSCFWVTMPV